MKEIILAILQLLGYCIGIVLFLVMIVIGIMALVGIGCLVLGMEIKDKFFTKRAKYY